MTKTFILPKKVNARRVVPESVEDDGAPVKFIARVEQLSGHDRSVTEAGRLAADFLAVQNDVFSMSSEEQWSLLV